MNRRLVLKMLAASSVSDLAVSTAVSAEDRILEMDCTELLARIRDGSLRAEGVCARFLQQYESQRSLNVVTWIDQSKALSRARNVDLARDKGARLPALAGLPILIKDNIDTIGFPTSVGTGFLKQNFPQRNAPVVDRLLQHGAIVIGKANMHELALGVTSSNPTFGFVHNPYNLDLIPGGSSGGSAAAIAARIVPAALGTDTGGSVRIPAAFCGTVGFRPSIFPRRLYSTQGVVPLARDFDTIGPMGRSIPDVAMLHAVIVGEPLVRPRSLKKARIGVPRIAYWDDLDPEVERVAQAALARLRDEGTMLVEIDLSEVKDAAYKHMALDSTIIPNLEEFLRAHLPSVSLHDMAEQVADCNFRATVEKGEAGVDSNRHNGRGPGLDAIHRAYRAVFRQNGIQAVVFPTVVIPPPRIRASGAHKDEMIEFNGRMLSEQLTVVRNTLPTAAFGAPAVSLPAGLTTSGLPIGLEFDGLPGDDSPLLALVMAAESAIGRVPAPPHVVPRSAANSDADSRFHHLSKS